MVVVTVNEVEKYCVVEPQGALSQEDFVEIAKHVDPIIEREGELDGLIIRTRAFPGWENVAGLLGHFRFVRDHHKAIEKVALVTDASVPSLLPALVKHFVKAEVRQFPFDGFQQAVDWVD